MRALCDVNNKRIFALLYLILKANLQSKYPPCNDIKIWQCSWELRSSKLYNYRIAIATNSLEFTWSWNLLARQSLVSFNVSSQYMFSAIFAGHRCCFTAGFNVFLDKRGVYYNFFSALKFLNMSVVGAIIRATFEHRRFDRQFSHMTNLSHFTNSGLSLYAYTSYIWDVSQYTLPFKLAHRG